MFIAYNDIILKNRNFLFEFNCSQTFEFINKILIHVIDFTVLIILIYNVTIAFIRLSRKARLETFFEYKQNNGFLTIYINVSLIIKNMQL